MSTKKEQRRRIGPTEEVQDLESMTGKEGPALAVQTGSLMQKGM